MRIVLVGIEGGANLGMILRLCSNFDIEDVALVNPGQLDVDEIQRFAVRAFDRYKKVSYYSSLDDALRDCDVRVCTSAKYSIENDVLRSSIPLKQLPKILLSFKKPCIVFGRESTGLTREELSKCDFLSTIPTSQSYPALNLANSVAIYLYELYTTKAPGQIINPPEREKVDLLFSIFEKISKKVIGDELKAKRALIAFKHIVQRSSPSRVEISILTYVLRRVLKRIDSEENK